VSKPMLYAYFGCKDELYLAAIRRSGEALRRRIAQAIALDDSAERRMWHGLLALLDAVEEHPEWWLLSREAIARGGEAARLARRMHEDMMGLIGGEFAQAADDSGAAGSALKAIDVLGSALAGACLSTCHWWIEHPEVPKGTVAIQLMNVVWMGFGNLVNGFLWIPEEARDSDE
jgi:AcrR family transcriptional regulator